MIRLILLVCLFGAFLSPATAQYQWLDRKGRMVFSDLPPPHNIDPKRVIKGFVAKPRPAVKELSEWDLSDAAGNGQAAPVAAAAPKESSQSKLAERLAEFTKQRKEREQKQAETQAKNLAAARQRKICSQLSADTRALKSGMRLARVNEKGERIIIDDNARSERLNENAQLMKKHC